MTQIATKNGKGLTAKGKALPRNYHEKIYKKYYHSYTE
jgi:hypothetical protein